MKRSTERILTTHTGSLPRPMELARMLEAKDAGEPTDDASLAQQAREAVDTAVRKQREAGIDIVSDGEQGKVGYSTYPRHRLTGFGGISSAPARADWADFPEASKRYGQSSTVNRPACNAPLEWADREAYKTDIANFQAAVEGANATEAFMTAASPGVIALFLGNEHYSSHEAYVGRLADLMKEEYEGDRGGGLPATTGLPRPSHGTTHAFRGRQRPRILPRRRRQLGGPESRNS